MDTLITAMLVIGGLFVAGLVLAVIDNKVEESTGHGLGDWAWHLVNTGILVTVGYGGLLLVRWGMNDDRLAFVIVGILVMGSAGLLVVGLWWFMLSGGGEGYNPMAGKRAHYNKDGKLTGYSDKD